MKYATRFLMIFCLAYWLHLPVSAQACTNRTNNSLAYFVLIAPAPSKVIYNPNVSVGSTIAVINGAYYAFNSIHGSLQIEYQCDTYYPVIGVFNKGIGTPDINKIYPTNIHGVGMKITGGFFAGESEIPFSSPNVKIYGSRLHGLIGHQTTITLIKTGKIRKGGIISSLYAQAYLGNNLIAEHHFSNPITLQPSIPTCSVVNKSVNVNLGQVALSHFTGPGSTSPEQAFELTLNCPGVEDNAWITLTDATSAGNYSTTLKLARDATAKGLGVQILRNGKVLGYGPDSDAPGTQNQWRVGRLERGQQTIALQARYVQTGASVSPGKATAKATFNMSYQ